ncbi:uncharacterized protein [Equus asinus]|uniref:uncharacterized protein n=1 Tax=Equus asinus TaxID=9793 RepID=UPI0038F7D93E
MLSSPGTWSSERQLSEREAAFGEGEELGRPEGAQRGPGRSKCWAAQGSPRCAPAGHPDSRLLWPLPADPGARGSSADSSCCPAGRSPGGSENGDRTCPTQPRGDSYWASCTQVFDGAPGFALASQPHEHALTSCAERKRKTEFAQPKRKGSQAWEQGALKWYCLLQPWASFKERLVDKKKARKEKREEERGKETERKKATQPQTQPGLRPVRVGCFSCLPLNEPFLSGVFKAALPPPNLGAFTLQTRCPPPCGNLKANKLLGSCSDTHLGICFISRLCASDLPNKSSLWISVPLPSLLPSLPGSPGARRPPTLASFLTSPRSCGAWLSGCRCPRGSGPH